MNPVAETLTGWSEAEATGKHLDEIFHIINEKTRRPVESPIARVLREGTVIGLANHTLLISKDGTERPIADAGAPILGDDEDLSGVVLVFRDQTKEREALRAIEDARALARNIIDTVRESLVVLNRELRVVSASRSFYQNFNLQPDEVEGQLFFHIKSGAWDIARLRDLLETILPQNTKFDNFEVEHEFAKLGKKTMLLNARRIYREPEKTDLILLAIEDITDMKRKEAELKEKETQLHQLQKMESIGTLAGGVAHDFNNLLTAINGHAELSLLTLEQTHPLYEALAAILAAGKKAQAVAQQLLAFSRKQIYKPRVIDVNQIISDSHKVLRRLITEDINMELVLAPQIPRIKADPIQIEQILINLLVNARDALQATVGSPEYKTITIETEEVDLDESYAATHLDCTPGHYVMLSVSDNGIGMDEETKLRAFEPFFTTKEAGKGTGMGLATVYGIVEQNNGSIFVYSEPGEGSTFKIYWPVTEELEIKTENQAPIVPEAVGHASILLVEDDKDVLKLVSDMLTRMGHKVHAAKSGKTALDLVQRKKLAIDLLLTDLIMPGMNGKVLADRIQELLPGVKVLFTSGYTTNYIVQSGVLETGVHFIQKPFTYHALAKAIRDALAEA